MKKILYLATTINGYIAKENDVTEWSEEEWEEYRNRISKAGALIIGKKTYEIMKQDLEFVGMNCLVAVITHDVIKENKVESFSSPHEALTYFEGLGKQEVYITGGSKINALFLKEKLIDEVIFDIEPLLYGKGIPLIFPEDIEVELSFVGTKMLSDKTIQITYNLDKYR